MLCSTVLTTNDVVVVTPSTPHPALFAQRRTERLLRVVSVILDIVSGRFRVLIPVSDRYHGVHEFYGHC